MNSLLKVIVVASLAITTASQAQTADGKRDWASKVVALQQGPELDGLVRQLAGSTTQELMQSWGPKLQANVAKAKQKQVTEELNAALKKYSTDVTTIIGAKVNKVSSEVLVPAYAERFTPEELQQIAAFFDSPAIKKYQAAAPELSNILVRKLIDETRADVVARAAQFDEIAAKIVGTKPTTKKGSGAPADGVVPAK